MLETNNLMLKKEAVLSYLRDQGLLPEEIKPVSVTAQLGRNVNWCVEWEGGGYFVKNFIDSISDFTSIFDLECALAIKSSGSIIAPVIIDAHTSIVVYPLIKNGLNGVSALFDNLFSPVGIVRGMASTLKAANNASHDLSPIIKSRAAKPWALTLDCPSFSLLRELTPAGQQVLMIVQKNNTLRSAIQTASNNWTLSGIVHGDVKLTNFIENSGTWILIDWELVHIGDPIWDWACLIASIFSTWILSAPQNYSSASDIIKRSVFSYSDLVECVNDLISEVKHADQLTLVTYIVTRLVQTAFECTEEITKIPIPSVLILQLAENLATDPQWLYEMNSRSQSG